MRRILVVLLVLTFGSPAPADQAPPAQSVPAHQPGMLIPSNTTSIPAKGLLTPIQGQKCCKICRKGKACGDSCISRAKRCRKPPGCACDAP